jgi:hypothetical protein
MRASFEGWQPDQRLQVGLGCLAQGRGIRQFTGENPDQPAFALSPGIEDAKVQFVIGDHVQEVSGNDHAARGAEVTCGFCFRSRGEHERADEPGIDQPLQAHGFTVVCGQSR